MVTVRSAKSKGSTFEYSVKDSLLPLMNDIHLTKELGFQEQYDLRSDLHQCCIECKRHKCFSWNELEKLFTKLESKTVPGYKSYLVFQANRQPPLVMFKVTSEMIKPMLTVQTFETFFGIPFIKHVGVKNQKKIVEAEQ